MSTISRSKNNPAPVSAGLAALIVLSFLISGAEAKVLMIDTFNSKQDKNMLGGAMGTWIGNPSDESQGSWSEFSDKEKFGDAGSSLFLKYDVDSVNPAFGGYWMKLENADVTPYTLLVFFIKGDAASGYPTKFAIELKSEKQTGRFVLRGVTNQWQKMAIPLSEFEGLTDLSALSEIVFIFAQDTVDNLTGAVYLDELCFTDGTYEPIKSKTQEKTLPAKDEDDESSEILAEAKKEGLEVREENGAVVITVRINFDVNRYDIRKSEIQKVEQVAGILKKHTGPAVQVIGYTDNRGSKALNKKLSENRAASVKEELAKRGVAGQRLTSLGKGPDNPVADNSTVQGRAKNRRVEFIIGK